MNITGITRYLLHRLAIGLLGALLTAIAVFVYVLDSRPDLSPWHTVVLEQEYSEATQAQVHSFQDYLQLEQRLFDELQQRIYRRSQAGAPDNPLQQKIRELLQRAENKQASRQGLSRFDAGSLADPTHYAKNWNRSYILAPPQPVAGVLLLHGLSDSPYSLRHLAQALYEQGYYVVGLRLPGHGTAPSGLLHARWQDMAAAVKLAMRHLDEKIPPPQPVYIAGYSMGAAQAVYYALDALQDEQLRRPDALALISPALGISPIASLAVWQARLAVLFGLDKLAWNSIGPEYDPYKYNSFAVNAGDQMYRLTQAIQRQLDSLEKTARGSREFPPTLAVQSLVDATVQPVAVARLLHRLENRGNRLMLFDINRHEVSDLFLNRDPLLAYRDILQQPRLPFDLGLLSNASTEMSALVLRQRYAGQSAEAIEPTDLQWPSNVYSLSHVALPFPDSDSLYGSRPAQQEGLHIGLLQVLGERGVLNVPPSDMLRLRYNPFYHQMQQWILDFFASVDESD